MSVLESRPRVIAITFSLPDESRDFLRLVRVTARSGTGVGSMIRGTLRRDDSVAAAGGLGSTGVPTVPAGVPPGGPSGASTKPSVIATRREGDSARRRAEQAGRPCYPSSGGAPVIVWHIGVGRERAAREAARLLADAKPELVICAGYGGALAPGMPLGEIVIDTRGAKLETPLRARAGRIFTAAHVAESVEEKRRLGEETGALAVDMETSVVAEVFERAGIPVIGVRAISDRLEDAVPVPMDYWFDLDRQRPRVLALLGFLARNPTRIVPFARFVRGLAPARAALAKTLADIVSALAPASRHDHS